MSTVLDEIPRSRNGRIRVSTRSVPDAWRDYVYRTGEIDGDDGGGLE